MFVEDYQEVHDSSKGSDRVKTEREEGWVGSGETCEREDKQEQGIEVEEGRPGGGSGRGGMNALCGMPCVAGKLIKKWPLFIVFAGVLLHFPCRYGFGKGRLCVA